ncbi:MAG: DCC1-like thiol-disulfide oxidoreductase family protein [Acidimicrobiia bacterium]
MTPSRPVLLYDGECKFCRFCAAAIAACDLRGNLGILPFGDPEAAALLEPVPAAERRASMHLARPGGSVASAGDAVLDLVGLLLRSSSAGTPANRPDTLRRIAGRTYSAVANARGTIGRFVPDVAVTRRPR